MRPRSREQRRWLVTNAQAELIASDTIDNSALHDIVYSMAAKTKSRRKKIKFPPQPAIEDRPLIRDDQASALMRLFKVFASDTRLRLLHALVRDEELCVSEMADEVDMKPQAVSNQLQRLVDRGILSSRRSGSNVYYRIVDPCVPVLLERGMCLIECCPE
jgi:DNA-binding transcriptional ArsR family regulator